MSNPWEVIETIMEGKAAAAHEAMPTLAGKPYRPGSGSEGMAFDDTWCCHCTRDQEFRSDPDSADGCPILANTFAYAIDDPNYPKEWVYGHDGRPCCTGFATDPAQPLRCDKTVDLFAEQQQP